MLMKTIQRLCKSRSLLNRSKISLKSTSCQLCPIQWLHTKNSHELLKVDTEDRKDPTALLAKVLRSNQMVCTSPDLISIEGPVLIGWDIENCNVRSSGTGEDTCQKILIALREWLHVRGPVIHFRAYGDVTNLGSAVKQSLHDSMVNCLHAPGWQAADHIMINDILIFTRTYSPPAVIVVISGDGGFASTLHMLKQLGYTVISILPGERPVRELKGSANHTMYLPVIVEGRIRRPFRAKDKGKEVQLRNDLYELVRRHGPIHISAVHSMYNSLYKENLTYIIDTEERLRWFVNELMKGILEVRGGFLNLATPKPPMSNKHVCEEGAGG